jgi:hypothetical protein
MPFRFLLAALALSAAATVAEAGPFRRYARPAYQSYYQPTYQPAYQPAYQPVYQPPTAAPSAEPTAAVTPAGAVFAPAGGLEGDGLDEVNAKRAARGLRPFLRDEGLTQAARACAQFRAAHGLAGHTANDFGFVPAGTFASSAGCAAVGLEWGWMSCCTYENYTYAGAAAVMGRDGRRYMHLFVR